MKFFKFILKYFHLKFKIYFFYLFFILIFLYIFKGLTLILHRNYSSSNDSNNSIKALQYAIKNSSDRRFDSLWLASKTIMGLEDNFQQKRVELVLDLIFSALKERKKESAFVSSVNQFLTTEAEQNQFVEFWKDENTETWSTLLEYQYPVDSEDDSDFGEDFDEDDL